MTIDGAIEEFLKYKSSYCERRTVEDYREKLGYFRAYLDGLGCITLSELASDARILCSYVSFLRSGVLKNVSVRSYYRSVKVFCRWLLDEEYIQADLTKKVKLPKDDSRIIEPLTAEEVRRLDACLDRKELQGLRNYCMVHLMLDCGLRLGDVVKLSQAQLRLDNGYLIAANSKNRKSRAVLVPAFLADELKTYIFRAMPGYNELFLSSRSREPVTGDTVRSMIQKLKKAAGISRLHAHLLRHTFATSYVAGGGNLEFLRLYLGHSDYNITRHYLHLANQQQVIRQDIYRLDPVFFQTPYCYSVQKSP